MRMDLKKIDVERTDEGNFVKIEDFLDYKFKRYKAVFTGKWVEAAMDGDDEDLRLELEFSSVLDNPSDALMRMFEIAEVSMAVDAEIQSRRPFGYSITVEHSEISTEHVLMYIKRTRPDIKSISIDSLEVIDNFRYLLYSNLKWASELLRENLDGIVFESTLDKLYDSMGDQLNDLKNREGGTMAVPLSKENA